MPRRLSKKHFVALTLVSLFLLTACPRVPENLVDLEKRMKTYGRGLGVEFPVNKIFFTSPVAGTKKNWKSPGIPDGSVNSVNTDGTGPTWLPNPVDRTRPRIGFPDGLALDLFHRQMYWSDRWDGSIRTADLSGQHAELLLPRPSAGNVNVKDPNEKDLAQPTGIALDIQDNLLFWIERGNGNDGTLNCADMRDGSNRRQLAAGLHFPESVALELASRTHGVIASPAGLKDHYRIYWSEHTEPADGPGSGQIKRGDIDYNEISPTPPPTPPPTPTPVGPPRPPSTFVTLSNVTTIIDDPLDEVRDIALDQINSRVYWIDKSNGVSSANLDGSQRKLVYSQFYLNHLALDMTNKKIYFTRWDSSGDDIPTINAVIYRRNLDGSSDGLPNDRVFDFGSGVVTIALGDGTQ